MRHPLERIPKGWPRVAALLLLLGLTYWLRPRPEPALKTAQAGWGIVSLELAFTEERAGHLIASWGPARDAAIRLQAQDDIWLLVYSTTLALACVMVSGRFAGLLAWAQWLAGLFDFLENRAISQMLAGAVAAPWPQVAGVCASLKFLLILSGLVYLVSRLGSSFPAKDP